MEQCCPLATVEPESQACSTNVMHSMPRGSILERSYLTKSARRGEASATCRGVVSGPRAPVFGKKHVELFFVLYVARVVFYQCSPYCSSSPIGTIIMMPPMEIVATLVGRNRAMVDLATLCKTPHLPPLASPTAAAGRSGFHTTATTTTVKRPARAWRSNGTWQTWPSASH